MDMKELAEIQANLERRIGKPWSQVSAFESIVALITPAGNDIVIPDTLVTDGETRRELLKQSSISRVRKRRNDEYEGKRGWSTTVERREELLGKRSVVSELFTDQRAVTNFENAYGALFDLQQPLTNQVTQDGLWIVDSPDVSPIGYDMSRDAVLNRLVELGPTIKNLEVAKTKVMPFVSKHLKSSNEEVAEAARSIAYEVANFPIAFYESLLQLKVERASKLEGVHARLARIYFGWGLEHTTLAQTLGHGAPMEDEERIEHRLVRFLRADDEVYATLVNEGFTEPVTKKVVTVPPKKTHTRGISEENAQSLYDAILRRADWYVTRGFISEKQSRDITKLVADVKQSYFIPNHPEITRQRIGETVEVLREFDLTNRIKTAGDSTHGQVFPDRQFSHVLNAVYQGLIHGGLTVKKLEQELHS